MKVKALIATLALGFLGTAAHAENRIGVLAGIDSNKLSFDGASSDSRTGFLGGVFGQYDYNGNLFGEVQVRLARKGGETLTTAGGVTTELSTGATWLEIPVYAKYKLMTDAGIIPFAFAGPSLAFKVGSSATEKVTSPGTFVERNTDGDFNFIDLGLDFGVGAEYAVYENINVSLSAAYNLGLLDVLGNGSAQNRGFQFYAGVSMPY